MTDPIISRVLVFEPLQAELLTEVLVTPEGDLTGFPVKTIIFYVPDVTEMESITGKEHLGHKAVSEILVGLIHN
jgi:hypothetical protein